MIASWFSDFSFIFVSLFVQGIPFLFIASLLGVTAIHLFPVERWIQRLPQARWASSLLGGLAGFFIPSCECVSVPAIRRLVQVGLPVPAAVAYLFASPVLNPLCIISTWTAFYNQQPFRIVALRVGGSFFISFLLAWIISMRSKDKVWRDDLLLSINPRIMRTIRPRLPEILANVIHDFLQISFLYIAGCALTAALQTAPFFSSFYYQTGTNEAASILSLMLAGMLMNLCSSVDAFIANAWIGYPLAAKIAFLWTGPILGLKLLLIYQTLFRKRAILNILIISCLLVFCMSWVVGKFYVF